jgi:hypothetical protein
MFFFLLRGLTYYTQRSHFNLNINNQTTPTNLRPTDTFEILFLIGNWIISYSLSWFYTNEFPSCLLVQDSHPPFFFSKLWKIHIDSFSYYFQFNYTLNWYTACTSSQNNSFYTKQSVFFNHLLYISIRRYINRRWRLDWDPWPLEFPCFSIYGFFLSLNTD